MDPLGPCLLQEVDIQNKIVNLNFFRWEFFKKAFTYPYKGNVGNH